MEDLHKQFVKLGRERHKITYKLMALLPKIYEQEIYKEHYPTIYEYAGKLAGLSRRVVDKALKLDKKLEDKPCLQKAIETQGIHKVEIVAHIATPETDKALADKVENMSKSSLLEFRKEFLGNKQEELAINLDPEAQKLFFKLKKKLGRELSNKSALKKMLKLLDQEEPVKTRKSRGTKPGSRPISAARKREVGNSCAFPGCNKPAEIFHHRERFSESHNHDSLVGLCREHHEFAHNGLIANEKNNPETWELKLSQIPTEQSDILYRKYRQAALL